MSMQDDPRTTKGITHEQRYHLCLKKHQCPSMKQSELAAWFKERYSFPISQPAISHSLKRSNEILSGGLSMPGIEAKRVRKRPVRHPELELAIYQWVKSRQQFLDQNQSNQIDGKPLHNNNHDITTSESASDAIESITGPVLLRQAKRIAKEMNINDTVFCPGWLSRFKARYGLMSTDKDAFNSRNTQYSCPSRNLSTLSPSSSFVIHPFQDDISVLGLDMIREKGYNNTSSTEAHPSISVPTLINSSHTSLHYHNTPGDVQPQSPTVGTSVSPINQISTQHQQPQEMQKQRQQQRRDTQFIHQYRRHPYCNGSSASRTVHGLVQQSIALENQSGTTLSSASSSIGLTFLQSIPISSSSSSNSGSGSLSPSIPLPIGDVRIVQSEGSGAVNINGDISSTDTLTCGSSTKINIQTLSHALAPPSLQEAQQLVHQIRHYVRLHLQDPTTALQSLVTLERELESTKTRKSITISEVDDILS